MAKATLPTNYRDDILNVSTEGKRKYRMNYNDDGTVSFVDVTPYDQEGSDFGAGDINATNEAVNQSFDKSKLIRDMDAINALTQEGFAPDALALKDVNDSLKTLQDIVYNQLYPDGYPLIPTLSANNASVFSDNSRADAYMAFDNDDTTYGAMLSNGQYVGYDLGSVQTINAVKTRVGSGSGGGIAISFKLQYSDNNSTWTDLYTHSTAGSVENFDFKDLNISARYVRVLSTHSGSSSYGTCVYRLQCYKKLQ